MEKETLKFSFFNKRSDTKNGKSDTTKTTDGGFFKKQKILIRPVVTLPKQSAEIKQSSNEDEAYDPFQPTEDIMDTKFDEAYDPFEPTASDNDDDLSIGLLQSDKSLDILEINEDVLSPTSTQSSEDADVFDVDRLLDSKFDASFTSKQSQKSDIKTVTAKHHEKKKTPPRSDFDIFAEEELEKAQAAAVPLSVEPLSPEPSNSKKFNKLRKQIKSAFSSENDPLAPSKNEIAEKEKSEQEYLRVNTESKVISAVEDDVKLESKDLENINASDEIQLLNSSPQIENDKVLKTEMEINQENVLEVSDKYQKVSLTPDKAVTKEKSSSNKSLSPKRKRSHRRSRSPSYKRHRSSSKKRSRSRDRKTKKSLEKSRKERSRSRSTDGKRRKKSRSRSRHRSHKKSNRSLSRTPRHSAKKRKRSRSRSHRSSSRKKQAQSRSRSPQKESKKKRKSRSRSRRRSIHQSQRSRSKSPKKKDKKSHRSRSKSKSRSFHAVTDLKSSRSKTPKKSSKKSRRSRSKSKSRSPRLKLDSRSKSPKKNVKKSRKSRSKSRSKSLEANFKRSRSKTPKKHSKQSRRSKSKSQSPQTKADSKHSHSKIAKKSAKKSHLKSRSESKSVSPYTKHSHSPKISKKEESHDVAKTLKTSSVEKIIDKKTNKKKKKDVNLLQQERPAKQKKEDVDDKKHLEKEPQVKAIDTKKGKSDLVSEKIDDNESVGKSTKKKKKKKKHSVEESSDIEEMSQSKKKKKHKKRDDSAIRSSEEKSIKAHKKGSHYKDDDESDYERKSKKKKKHHHHSDESDFGRDASDVSRRSKKHKRHAQSPDSDKSPRIKEKKSRKKYEKAESSHDESDVGKKESKKEKQKRSSREGHPQTVSDADDFNTTRKPEKKSSEDHGNDKNELSTFLAEKQSKTNVATDEVKSVNDTYGIKDIGSVDLSGVKSTVAETVESVDKLQENADKIVSSASQDLDIDFLLEEPFKYAEDEPAPITHEKNTLDSQSCDPLDKKELRSPSPLSPSLLSPASSPPLEEINSQNSSMIMSSQEFKETPSYAETFLEQSRKRWEKSLRTKSPHVSATPDDSCTSENSQKKPSTVKTMQGLFSLSDISLDTAEKSKMSSDDTTNIETSASVEDIFADFSDNTSKVEQPKTVQSTTFESVMKLEASDILSAMEANEKVAHYSTTNVSQDTDIRHMYEDIKLNAETATTTEEADKKAAEDKSIKESSPKPKKARSKSPEKDERSPTQRKRSRSPSRSHSKRHEDKKKQDRRRRSRSYERRSRRRRSPSRSPQRKHSHRKRNSSRDKRRSDRSKSPEKSRYRQERKRTSQHTDRALGNQPANIAMTSQPTDIPLAAQATGIVVATQFNESALNNQASGIFLAAQPPPEPVNIEILNKFLEQSAKYASLPAGSITQEQAEKVSTSPQPIATISGVASAGFPALPRADENLHISEDIEQPHEIATSTFQTLVRESRPALIQIPTIDSHTSQLETNAKPTKKLETKPAEDIELYSPSRPISPDLKATPSPPPKATGSAEVSSTTPSAAASLFSKLFGSFKKEPEINSKDLESDLKQDEAKDKEAENVLNPTQILNIAGLNPQQQSAAKDAIMSIAELSKHLQLGQILSNVEKAKKPPAVAQILEEEALSPANSDEIESSAVAMYNKDKRKIQQKKKEFQDKVVATAKSAIKPHYERREVNKEQYKDIMKRAVNKICQTDKTMEVNEIKIRRLIRRYVECYQQKNEKNKEKMKLTMDQKLSKHDKEYLEDTEDFESPPSPVASPFDDPYSPIDEDLVSVPTLLKKEPRKIVTLPDLPLPPPPPPPRPKYMT